MRPDEYARTLLGTPWAHQGRTSDGVDCVGLCVLALRAAGVTVPDRTDYGRDPDGTLRTALDACMDGPHGDPRAGDVVLIRFRAERHVGIVGEDAHGLTLIHADSHNRRVVEHRIDDRWRARIVGAWRVQT